MKVNGARTSRLGFPPLIGDYNIEGRVALEEHRAEEGRDKCWGEGRGGVPGGELELRGKAR